MKISRKEFLKYCISSAVVLGLDQSMLGKLSKAMANTGPNVLWLTGSSCTGCTVSLANLVSTTAPVDVADLLINVINLDYHVNLMGAAGDQAVQNLRNVAAGSYILVVEGGIPSAFNGNACILWNENGTNVTALAAVKDLASHSIANIAVGTCASFGGTAAAAPNPTGVTSFSKAIGKSVINIPGCPTHPDWVVSVIAQLLTGTAPALDSNGRPTNLFRNTVHDQCPRQDNNRATQFGVASQCLRSLGCKGPNTTADCPNRLWNNKVSTCINANAQCIGCADPTWPQGPLYNVTSTSTIPAQASLAVSAASWDAANQVLVASGTGKIGSQAAVKSPAGELLASTMISRTGTWSFSKAGLSAVPSSIVVISDIQSITANVTNAPAAAPFVMSSAVYAAGTNKITVAGTGAAGATVTLSSNGGLVLGVVTVATNGSWSMSVTSPSPVPTTVSAVSNGVTATANVTGIPAGTAFAISSAAYTAGTNRLVISGTGAAGASVTVTGGGASLGTATIAANGSWSVTATSPSPVPTSVSAISSGVTKTASVTGIPASVMFAVSSAAWNAGTRQLTVAGTATAGSSVTVMSSTGTLLGSAVSNASGNWNLGVANPSTVPVSITATCNGKSITASVQNAPVSSQALTVTTAQWDRSNRRLTTAGKGTASQRVSVYDNNTNVRLGTTYVNSSSRWTLTLVLSSAPRNIRAVSNGQTVIMSVTGSSTRTND